MTAIRAGRPSYRRGVLAFVLFAAAIALPQRSTQLASNDITVPLGPWIKGVATNYGSAFDGMSPYDPSFGTKEVGQLSACRLCAY